MATRVIPSGGFGLYRIDPDSARMLDVKAEVKVDFLGEYEEYGRRDDPVLNFVVAQRRPVDSTRATDRTTWRQCGACSAIGIGGYHHSLEAPIIVSGALYGTINFAREAASPAFDQVDLVSARIVADHLGLATERALRFEQCGERSSTLEHVLDRIPQALVVTDLDGRVIFKNRSARSARLPTSEEGASGPIANAIADAIADAMEEFRVRRRRTFTRCVVDPATRRRSVVKSLRLSSRDGAAMTLVYQCPDGSAVRLPAWDVLSKREQQIADLVSQGLTNKQIAKRAFVSENTVKQHLKRVFVKTDVRNRAELMQRIWASGTDGPGQPEAT
ncbi:MAG: LuxR C-terminal-related transcriptional regulator [Acidimicrobiales bacterium]